jgi:hypothetical protein
MKMIPVQMTTVTLGPQTSRKMPLMIGQMELAMASEALMIPN